jgi:uncharacterized protein YigE (DUF2233 family)
MSPLISGKRKGISNWFRQFATVIDPIRKLYKIEEGMLGLFKWGAFQPLPRIDYVLVFRQVFAKCEACSIDEYENYEHSYYQVSLVHNKNRRIIVHETKQKQEAFELAAKLSSALALRIKDSASQRGKSMWLADDAPNGLYGSKAA